VIVAIIGVAGMVVVAGAGALVYFNRDKLGLPELGSLKDGIEKGLEEASEDAGERPRVASAPIKTDERIYNKYVGRDDVLVMVDYYADWCGPCRMIAPHLSTLAARHGDKVVVLKVNVDHQRALAGRAGVRGIPDVRLLHAGRSLEHIVGGRPYEHYEALVLKHASKLPAPSGSNPARPAAASNDGGSITPMKQDWAPPGVTPVK